MTDDGRMSRQDIFWWVLDIIATVWWTVIIWTSKGR